MADGMVDSNVYVTSLETVCNAQARTIASMQQKERLDSEWIDIVLLQFMGYELTSNLVNQIKYKLLNGPEYGNRSRQIPASKT